MNAKTELNTVRPGRPSRMKKNRIEAAPRRLCRVYRRLTAPGHAIAIFVMAGSVENRAAQEECTVYHGGKASRLGDQDITFVEMHTYSEVDYSYVQAGVGIEYRIAPSVTLTADADYADLQDDSGGYVYGVETGSYFMIRTGARLEF